jgi:hypothetical protein
VGISSQEIIKRGYVDVHVRVAGIRQIHRLIVRREHTAFGEIPCLTTNVNIATAELLRIADELGLPVKSQSTLVFPKGKGPNDFVDA